MSIVSVSLLWWWCGFFLTFLSVPSYGQLLPNKWWSQTITTLLVLFLLLFRSFGQLHAQFLAVVIVHMHHYADFPLSDDNELTPVCMCVCVCRVIELIASNISYPVVLVDIIISPSCMVCEGIESVWVCNAHLSLFFMSFGTNAYCIFIATIYQDVFFRLRQFKVIVSECSSKRLATNLFTGRNGVCFT